VSNAEDNQDHPSTLPSPELNPLTNPVLGRHMGRWAEVYFTSPPEKREQAVQELLRELERDAPATEGSARATAAAGETINPAEAAHTLSPATFSSTSGAGNGTASPTNFETNFETPAPLREEFIQCRSCGRLALVEQKFCGACGSALPERGSVPEATQGNDSRMPASAAPEPGLESQAQTDRFGQEWLGEERFGEEAKFDDREFGNQKDFQKTDRIPAVAGSSIHNGGLGWERTGGPIAEEPPRLFLDQQLARHRRSRRLMGAALAILVGTLFCVAARGTAAWLRAHEASQNATAKTDSAAGRPSPNARPLTPDQPAPVIVSRAVLPTPAGYSPTGHAEKGNAAEHAGAVASPQKGITATNAADPKLNPSAEHALAERSLSEHGGRGAEELAIAESYLSATQGKARDSSEAAQWLWKSVGKQNAAAALLLSDLYVTGDGVPRSCDQARLLLDAAARKGVPGAGERIRDLPNLGCQ